MTDFQDKLAVVFGGGRDIGGAIAVELARRGAQVALSYHGSNPDKVIRAIEALGQKPYSQKVDALDMAAVRAFATSSAEQAGKKIAVLVNVVGGLVARKTHGRDGRCLLGLRHDTQHQEHLCDDPGGLTTDDRRSAIVNVSSQAGRDGGGPGGIAYGASKGALMSMTRGLAKELGPRRIRVNAVCPGMIATKFHDEFTKPEVRQRVAGMTPLGREGMAEEVANLVVYLASEGASFVNGSNVDITEASSSAEKIAQKVNHSCQTNFRQKTTNSGIFFTYANHHRRGRKAQITLPKDAKQLKTKTISAKRPATLADVAKMAGVVAMTTSRAINQSGAEVRQRVSAAVKRLNYRPNMVARQLRGPPFKCHRHPPVRHSQSLLHRTNKWSKTSL